MKSEKLYIKAPQKIGFKAFAVIAYIILFVIQRLPALSIEAAELRDVSENFSVSSLALGNFIKFFDYFAVPVGGGAISIIVIAAVALVLGLVVLALSLFPYRRVQVLNFVLSVLGTLVSVALAILITVFVPLWNADGALSDILGFSAHYIITWLPAVLFMVGTIFIYAYAKMPSYRLSDGRFFKTLLNALAPKNFTSTFKKRDNTEALFRATVPLKQKKYATMSEPASIKKARKESAKRRGKMDYTQVLDEFEATDKKLSKLQMAVNRREHAERIANRSVESENRALLNKKKKRASARTSAGAAQRRASAPVDNRARALEIAKLKAKHAEEVAGRNKEIY